MLDYVSFMLSALALTVRELFLGLIQLLVVFNIASLDYVN